MTDGCGAKPSELLRISAQGSLWRKIPSAFLTMTEAARSTESCGRLPRSGTYANGTLSPLPTLVPRTGAKESGLWPTPTVFHALRGNHDEPVSVYLARVQDHKDGKTKGKPGPSLGIAVRMWPTPTAGDANGSGSRNTATSKAHPGISLTDAVLGDGGRGRIDAGNSGRLNPMWVEWLMGFPIGWTDCDASETPSCPRSPK
jgi:hypothetical protein